MNVDYKLWIINTKIHELEIMRRFYTNGGDHREAVQYIEQKKDMLCRHCVKKYCMSYHRAEEIYALALERMIGRINALDGQVTELTVSMMGLMNKVRKQERRQVCYTEAGIQFS